MLEHSNESVFITSQSSQTPAQESQNKHNNNKSALIASKQMGTHYNAPTPYTQIQKYTRIPARVAVYTNKPVAR